LLPFAATVHESLRIDVAVDDVLLRNARELLSIWTCWYPHLRAVQIQAEPDPETAASTGLTAACLSGGVNSFFTVLRQSLVPSASSVAIDDLLWVWGVDVPLDATDAATRLRSSFAAAATDLGKRLVPLATNARATEWERTDLPRLSHASLLAAAALALERRYRRVLIGATTTYLDLGPWGSHPVTDPRLSTSLTEVVHDGAATSHVDKARQVASSPAALRSLHVCWRSRSDVNCHECEECYRTMTTLWLLGALDRAATFDARRFDRERLRSLFCRHWREMLYVRDIARLAREKGRRDVALVLERVIRRSWRINRGIALSERLDRTPFLWRYAGALRRRLLRGTLR
jgi:hypothetical protein